ncbi:copper resistance system multicopper oxidase [Marinobacterium sediminicola]|uniref:Copper-resistance protein, CopA family n=1 Tax=Marinobacterium sediminicola TaxID=518898 RepID=A0ABY1RY08_9GAMM|nr:copper resistance system multicopper oxidase [Marinobacterium sediminicola]ULG68627.1 copper resistance system multicopper oxidase [Marinobacterium sediminicola]SMR73150.1 copper-resistance protein, CopA family [Marinobacterium sediminicola]
MSKDNNLAAPSRRRFVQGLALGGLVTGLGFNARPLLAAATPTAQSHPVLSGSDFNLEIGHQIVNFTGKEKLATTVNGSLPAPILRWREGDRVRLNVHNRLDTDSSIHWHGIILPTEMDGVPGLSFDGIAPGETFTYEFDVQQNGTYWYHSHSGFQEQTGLYGAIIIDPKEPEPFSYDRDHVVMLSDWSDTPPERIFANLKKMSHYYNRRERSLTDDLIPEIQRDGMNTALSRRQMWEKMRMSDRDISDVTGYTYTFLMNGQTPATGWTGLYTPGEKVRLRIINAAAMTFFDLRIPGLKMTVVACDGQYVQPVSVDEFRIGVAETIDVIVEPTEQRAYSLFAQAIDRSGYAHGHLTPDPALRATPPALDPAPELTHMDMGMAMDAHGHGEHSSHDMPSMGTDHSLHGMSAPVSGMMHQDHAAMPSGQTSMSHSNHSSMAMDHGVMTHDHAMPAGMQHGSGHGHHGSGHGAVPTYQGHPLSAGMTMHADSEYGPHVDMRAEDPQYRLDDPGVGLRNNGRKVLTYADLRSFYPTPDTREPGREIELHLTGNMSRYMWSINGIRYADAEPIHLQYGERVRITLVNDTMMPHPVHLHGMWSDLETGDATHLPRKHTLVVQPGARLSYLVTADARGEWAFHCHLLFHMMGMFRKVVVS